MLASDGLSNEQRVNDPKWCKPVRDIPLSTGATMSARFPVISPHGNSRSWACDASGKRALIVDRVVDGGYFENFGAITIHELATALRKNYGLDTLVILINNEPSQSNMDCYSYDHRIDMPKDPPPSTAFSVINSPFSAIMGTRSARGSLAAIDLCKELQESPGAESKAQGFAYITVDPNHENPAANLSMSWWLSKVVQKYLDGQLDLGGNSTNWKAFSSIESARRLPPEAAPGAYQGPPVFP